MQKHHQSLQRMLGVLMAGTGIVMLPPLLVSFYFGDGAARAFLESAGILLALGYFTWLPVRRVSSEFRVRDGFLVVVFAWAILGLGGALPLLISEEPRLTPVDAIFESVSGLTTTGATVITGLDDLPQSILFYRQMLQWLGGMGIIVLAVAILPMLRVGGMQLFRAETPGPMKDNKLTPRITETAKALWFIYLGLTIVCAAAYWLAGMPAFDAINHAFSTIAIGGFSTHDASLGYFDSALIESVAIVFMFLSGINFATHFMAWRWASSRPYLHDAELGVYTILILVLAIISSLILFSHNWESSLAESLRLGIFHSVSLVTTTGFTTDASYLWPGALPLMLLMASFVGGCAGSTAGGMKVIRIILIYKQGLREIARLVHPNAQIPLKIGGKSMPDNVLNAVWGFMALYLATFCFMSLMVMASGEDIITAVSAVAACLNNLGPALGKAGPHYADLNETAKWLLTLTMFIGRLEVFTVLVLFTPAFWKK